LRRWHRQLVDLLKEAMSEPEVHYCMGAMWRDKVSAILKEIEETDGSGKS